jgi:hypothetical protein
MVAPGPGSEPPLMPLSLAGRSADSSTATGRFFASFGRRAREASRRWAGPRAPMRRGPAEDFCRRGAQRNAREDARAALGGALSRRSSALEHYGAAAIYRFVERPGCFRIGQRWSPQRKHRIGVAGMQLLQVSRPPYVASVLTRRQILAVT